MPSPSLTEALPPYIPQSEIRVSENITFTYDSESTPQTVYTLEKRPFSYLYEVTAVVDGIQQDLTIGTDVTARDTDGDGDPDAVAFTNSDQFPDPGTTVTVTYVTKPTVLRYTETVDSDLDRVTEKINEARDARYVSLASGEQLDRIGELYGPLGRRLGRSDEAYRKLLRSIVQAFNARGTKPSVRFVTSAALQIDESTVSIDEDFENTEYTIVLTEWTSHDISTVYELADLADPSGVDIGNIKYKIDKDEAQVVDEATSSDGVQAVADVEADDDDVLVNIGVQETFETSQSADTVVQSIVISPSNIDRFDTGPWDDITWDGAGDADGVRATDHLASAITNSVTADQALLGELPVATSTTTKITESGRTADQTAGTTIDATVENSGFADGVSQTTTTAVAPSTSATADTAEATATTVIWDEGSWGSMDWD